MEAELSHPFEKRYIQNSPGLLTDYSCWEDYAPHADELANGHVKFSRY
jgi:hypothetical protein